MEAQLRAFLRPSSFVDFMNGVYYVRIAAYWIYWIPAPRVVHKIHITRDVPSEQLQSALNP
jgi:hypothetical protein